MKEELRLVRERREENEFGIATLERKGHEEGGKKGLGGGDEEIGGGGVAGSWTGGRQVAIGDIDVAGAVVVVVSCSTLRVFNFVNASGVRIRQSRHKVRRR